MKSFLDPPDLAIRPAAIFGRIQNDPVVTAPSTHLAAHEGVRVVDDPSDRRIDQTGFRLICPGEADGLLGRVDVGYPGAGASAGQGGETRIAEKVQYLARLLAFFERLDCKT